jgi:radical SAM superfamily enzyme YgiQ (UPF0313 family)
MLLNRKILFTTVYRRKPKGKRGDTYDYATTYMRRNFRYSIPRIMSYGLRFIKQNIPQVEILEYPTWEEYVERLKEGWDVVGFSFYINEIHEVIEMTEYARDIGIKELWAGNYGAMTDGIEKYFDKVFLGYAEENIAKELGKEIDRILHPPLIEWRGLSGGVKLQIIGRLFTTRGCNLSCKFCQTPTFCRKPARIPIESIEAVLRYYYVELGIKEISIIEESFGLFPTHAREVVNLLAKYGFYWRCMTRPSSLASSLNDWSKKGFVGASIGIENFNQGVLDDIGKRERIEEIIYLVKKLHEMQKSVIGYYMIGFENETTGSIKADIERLAKLKLDLTQICILTPLPKTPLWYEIEEKYGIFENDWHRYNLYHLVWNHPNITPEKMENLLNWSLRYVHSNRGFIRSARRALINYNVQEVKFLGGWRYMIKSMLRANRFNYFPEKIPLIEQAQEVLK